MTIQFVGRTSAGRNGNANATTTQSLTGLTGGIASQPAEGDYVFVVCVSGSQGRNPSAAISGYSTIGTQLNVTSTTYDTSLQVSYKKMTSTPDTSITIPAQGNVADAQARCVMVFRGVDPNTPFDVTSVSATGTTTTNFDAAAITPVSAGAWVVIAGGGSSATTGNYTAPTDFSTNWETNNGSDTNDASAGMGYYDGWTSGSVNPAATTGGTAISTASWAAWTFALRPQRIVTLDKTLDTVGLSAVVDTPCRATLTQTLGGIGLTAEGTVPVSSVSATLTQTLGGVSLSAAADTPAAASLNKTLDTIGLSASVAGTVAGEGTLFWGSDFWHPWAFEDRFWGQLTIVLGAVEGTLTQTLASVSLTTSVDTPAKATLSKTLEDLTKSLAAQAPVKATLSKTLETVGLSAAVDTPVEATLSKTLDGIGLSALVEVVTAGNAATLTQTLDSIALAAPGKAQVKGSLSKSLDSVGLVATAHVGVVSNGVLSKVLDSVSLSATAKAQAKAQASIVLGALTSVGSVASTIKAQAAITLDSVGLVARGRGPYVPPPGLGPRHMGPTFEPTFA